MGDQKATLENQLDSNWLKKMDLIAVSPFHLFPIARLSLIPYRFRGRATSPWTRSGMHSASCRKSKRRSRSGCPSCWSASQVGLLCHVLGVPLLIQPTFQNSMRTFPPTTRRESTELKKYPNVNKQALDQFIRATDQQQEELNARVEEERAVYPSLSRAPERAGSIDSRLCS